MKFRSDSFLISTDSIIGPAIFLCPAAHNTSLAAVKEGTQYQWQLDTCGGNCFVNISGDSHFSGTATRYLSVSNMQSSWNSYQFRCMVDGNIDSPYTIRYIENWIGAINNDWENPGNWDCNTVPDEYTDVIIKTGSPVVHASTSIRTLTTSGTANLTINNGVNLTVKH